MSTEPSITLEQTLRLGQSPEETQKHVKPLKQEAEITKMNRTFTHSPRHTQNVHHPIQGEPHLLAVKTLPSSENVHFLMTLIINSVN